MPRYAYACKSCHEHIERDVPMAARDAQTCYSCGSPLKRKFSTPHIAAIPGIPNRVNRHWDESGEDVTDKLARMAKGTGLEEQLAHG